MIINKKLITFLLVCICSLSLVFAEGDKRAGTNAAPQLMIPFGSSIVSMGGAGVANSIGLESIYWNPAGLDRIDGAGQAMFSHRQHIADMTVNYFGVAAKSGFGTIGVSLRSMSVGDIFTTTIDQPDGTGEKFSPAMFVLGVSYSKVLSDRISIGVNFNLISEQIDRSEASGFAVDAGVQYQDIFNVKGLTLGVVVKNLGGTMKYEGTGLWVEANDPYSERGVTFLTTEAGAFDLPSVISLGMAYETQIDENNGLTVAGAYHNNNYQDDEIRVGFEYNYQKFLFVRGGYLYSVNQDSDENIYQNFTAGFGLNLGNLIGGADITLDYAYVPVKFFDDNSVITLKVGF